MEEKWDSDVIAAKRNSSHFCTSNVPCLHAKQHVGVAKKHQFSYLWRKSVSELHCHPENDLRHAKISQDHPHEKKAREIRRPNERGYSSNRPRCHISLPCCLKSTWLMLSASQPCFTSRGPTDDDSNNEEHGTQISLPLISRPLHPYFGSYKYKPRRKNLESSTPTRLWMDSIAIDDAGRGGGGLNESSSLAL